MNSLKSLRQIQAQKYKKHAKRRKEKQTCNAVQIQKFCRGFLARNTLYKKQAVNSIQRFWKNNSKGTLKPPEHKGNETHYYEISPEACWENDTIRMDLETYSRMLSLLNNGEHLLLQIEGFTNVYMGKLIEEYSCYPGVNIFIPQKIHTSLNDHIAGINIIKSIYVKKLVVMLTSKFDLAEKLDEEYWSNFIKDEIIINSGQVLNYENNKIIVLKVIDENDKKQKYGIIKKPGGSVIEFDIIVKMKQ